MSSAIIIFCGECGTKIVTHKKHAGRAAICAECEAKVPIPHKPSEKPQLRLFCPGCNNRVSATLAKAGHVMICPKCEEEIDLPRVKIGEESEEKGKGKRKKTAAEWMPRGVKKKPSKPKKRETDVVPLKAADGAEDEEDEEDEILSLLRRMAGIEKEGDTGPVDVVEVLDDEEETGAHRPKPPKAIDEELQRAETQGMEPYEDRKRPPKKERAKEERAKGGTETFRFKCPECGFRILVRESDIGKKGRCPDCREVVAIKKA